MDNSLYDYSPIISRPKLVWPGGARVAFYVGLNIEHFEIDKPATSLYAGTAQLVPDPLNFGWRDYGVRVGIWRTIEALDKFGLRASALLNSDVTRHYPAIIEAGKKRNWAWVAHGKNNSTFQTELSIDQERAYLREVVTTISDATGQTIKGWMGPGLTETFETPKLLKELGLSYVLDWCADDQPFPLNVTGMTSIPYSVELNDINLFLERGVSGDEFVRIVCDQFDQLYREGEQSGKVMALALHPFVIGQAFRRAYLDKVFDYIASHQGVWLTTTDDIAAHYAAASHRA